MLIDTLKNIAIRIIGELKQELVDQNINASMDLSDSIIYRVSEHFIEIEMNEYGSFVETGTKPRESKNGEGFLDKIVRWTKYKGIPEEAAYPIYKHILEHGTKPHPWTSKFRTHILNLDAEILEYMGIRVENDYEKRFIKIWQ